MLLLPQHVHLRTFSTSPAAASGLRYIKDILMAEEASFLHLVQEVIEEPLRQGSGSQQHPLQVQKLRVLSRIKLMNLSLPEQLRMVAANRLIDHSSLVRFWESSADALSGTHQLPLPTAILLAQQMAADGELDLVADFLEGQFSFGDILMLGSRIIGSQGGTRRTVAAFELSRAFQRHGFAQQFAREFWIGDINRGLHFCLGVDGCFSDEKLQTFLYNNNRITYRLSKYNSGALLLDEGLKPYERIRLLEKYAELGNYQLLHNFFFNKAADRDPEWTHTCAERLLRLAVADSGLLELVKAVLAKKSHLPPWSTARVTSLVVDKRTLRGLWSRYRAQYHDQLSDPIVRQTVVDFLEKSVALADAHTASSVIKFLGDSAPVPLLKQYLRLLFKGRLRASESHDFDLITRLLNSYVAKPSEIMRAVGATWAQLSKSKPVNQPLLWDLIHAFEASKLPHWSQHMEKMFALALVSRAPVEKVEYYFLPKVSVRAVWLCIQTELAKAMEAEKGDVDRSGRLQLITIALMAIRIKSRQRRFQRGHFIGDGAHEAPEEPLAASGCPATDLDHSGADSELLGASNTELTNPLAAQLELPLADLPPQAQLERLQVPAEYLDIRDLDMFLLQHIGRQEKPFSALLDMNQWIYDILSVQDYEPNLTQLSVQDPGLAYRLIRWFRHDFMFRVPAQVLRSMVHGFAVSEELTNSMSFRYIGEVISQLRLQGESVGPEVCEELVDSLFARVAKPGASKDKKRLQWALMMAKQEQVEEEVVETWNRKMEDMKRRQVGFWGE